MMAQANQRTFNKIIWAVNPFDRNPKLEQSMGRFLRSLEEMKDASIQPVFVLSPSFATSSADFKRRPPTEDELIKKIQKMVRGSGLKTAKAPVILKEKSDSRRSEVKCLLEYCKQKNASMVAIATHARKGFPRLMLGSFAETLLLLSPTPLAFVNPHQSAPKSIHNILFPTDLGENSRKAFVWSLDLADEVKAKLIIYNALRIYQQGVFFTQDVGGVPFPVWITTDEAKQKGKIFLGIAKDAEVPAEFKYEEIAGSVVDAILKQTTKSNADLLSIAAEPIPKLPLMVGSITRQLIRRAPCPTYIYRPVTSR